jgi:hypothetical protein
VRWWAPLAAIVALLAATMLAALYADPVVERDTSRRFGFSQQPATPRTGVTGPVPSTTSPGTDRSLGVPVWVTYLISGLLAAVIVLIIGYLIWLALRNRIGQRIQPVTVTPGSPPTLEETRQSVRDVLDASLSDLDDTETDPRRAIIACWVRLEQAAAKAGVERQPADTSTDLVHRMLTNHLVVSGDVLAGLASLYREARFAPHVVDQTMRAQARAALVELRAELSRSLLHIRRPVGIES